MKRVIAIALVAFMLMPIVSQAIMVNETCVNDTHLQVTFEYDLTADDDTTTYEYTQTHHCTHNCSNDKCTGTTYNVDMTSVWLMYGVGVALLTLGTVLGIPYGKLVGREDIRPGVDTTVVVKYMFFFVGFYLMYLSLAMSRRIGALYGGGKTIIGASSTGTLVIMLTMVLFLFIFVIEFIFTVLKSLMDSAAERKWGGQRI